MSTYIKTNSWGIGKVREMTPSLVYLDKGVVFMSDIIEESDSILELLEVGDLINKEEIVEFDINSVGIRRAAITKSGTGWTEEMLEMGCTILTNEVYQLKCFKERAVDTSDYISKEAIMEKIGEYEGLKEESEV